MIDNKEMNRILSKLEDCEDEEQAVLYLKRFNSQSKSGPHGCTEAIVVSQHHRRFFRPYVNRKIFRYFLSCPVKFSSYRKFFSFLDNNWLELPRS
jgi:hypothetical protein